MKVLHHIMAGILFYCTVFRAGAAVNDLELRYLGLDEGFAHTNITSMYQDETGALWVEGLRGVSRYRGVIPEEQIAGTDSVLTRPSAMKGVFGEKKGKVYFNVYDNILEYGIHDESWNYVFRKEDLRGCIVAADVKDGTIYAVSGGRMLRRYSDGSVERTVLPSYFSDGISSMLVSSSGKVFFGTISDGVYSMDGDGNIVKEAECSSRVNTMYEDAGGELWICTRGEGLVRLSSEGIRTYSADSPSGNRLSDNYVRCVCEDGGGRMWIGMMLGLDCIDLSSDTVIRISDFSSENSNIRNLTIDCMLKDDSGTIWLGSYYAGLSYFRPDNIMYDSSYIPSGGGN